MLNIKRLIFIILVGLILPSCTKENIRVGFIAGLSGRNSELGVLARKAALLRVDMINKKGGIKGRKIELVIKDDKSDPKTAEQVAGELVKEGVVAVIGPLTSNMANGVIKATKSHNILVISPSVSTDLLTGIDDNFIRTIPAASIQGEVLAKHLMEIKAKSNVAIVHDLKNKAYTQSVVNGFKDSLDPKKGKVIYEYPMQQNKENFLTIAKEIKKSGADSILICTSSIDAASLAQQLHKMGSKALKLGSNWTKTNDLIALGGIAVEGMYVTSMFEREAKSEQYKLFESAFTKRYRMPLAFISTYTYDAMTLLEHALKNSKQLRYGQLKQSILNKKRFEGIEADIEIDRNGDTIRRYSISVVKNGTFKMLGAK
jgi:branched-chain amino acid transport system substrate-binding protein